MNNREALAYAESALGVSSIEELDALIACWPSGWDALSDEEESDIRRALTYRQQDDEPPTA